MIPSCLLNRIQKLHLVAVCKLRNVIFAIIVYSIRVHCDIYLLFDQCNSNGLRTAKEYAHRCPLRHISDTKVIHRMGKRLKNAGSVHLKSNLYGIGKTPKGEISPV